MGRLKSEIKIKNKKAEYEYFLVDTYTAGIVLTGTEIKSIRSGKASLNEAYCTFFQQELYVRQMHIAEYSHGTHYNHEPKQDRKLLLQKRELRRLEQKIKVKGYTIIPVLLYMDENGRAKLNIALAKGKKSYDKRESLKEKDLRRDMARSQD